MSSSSEKCFHCGLNNPYEKKYSVEINGKTEQMCCPGCQAVSESIIALGLTDYYQFREKLPETSPRDVATELEQLEFYDHKKILSKYVTTVDEHHQSIALMINGIVCAACTWLIETRLMAMPGISAISVNQSTSRATIVWDPETINLSGILKSINELGYQAHPYDQKLKEQQLIDEKKRALKRLAVAGLGMMQVMMYSLGFYLDLNDEMSQSSTVLLRWVSLLISAPVVFYSGSPFYFSAWKSIKNRTVNMDVPVTIAIFSAWFASLYSTVIGEGELYFDSVTMFVFFLLIGRYLQMVAIHRSGRVLEERLKSKPETVIRLNDHQRERVLLEDVVVGDCLIVKPGQQIPCDAVIKEGETSVDESILTGESLPLVRKASDEVAAGSVNTGNVITIEVLRTAENSTLSGIIQLLQKAQQTKPKMQLLADKVASYFVASVLVLATTAGLFWYWYDSSQVFSIVLAVLVVTCPCALSLATPVAITTGLGRLTEQSLLVNNASALLNLSELTDIVFDKTGTISTGNFSLVNIKNFSSTSKYKILKDSEILNIVSEIESHSEHPIASAFVNNKGNYNATNVIIKPGRGIQATIDNAVWKVGNELILEGLTIPDYKPVLNPGELALFLVRNDECLALLLVETEIKADAISVINQLKSSGLTVHMLSGDKLSNVQQMAEDLAFDHYQAEQSPEQKIAYLERLQSKGRHAAMIGDGINDSPAMAAALVSFAIAKSTDITKVSADLIMLSEQLSLIPDAIKTSKAVRRVVKQNLMWALSYNLLALPLAVSGLLLPWLAALGMSLSSLVVVLNALRLSIR